MSIFDSALATIMSAPDMGVNGVLLVDSATEIDCVAVWTQADDEFSGFRTGADSPARMADIRTAEAAEVEEGLTLTIGGTDYLITRAHQPDSDRLLWRVEVQPT